MIKLIKKYWQGLRINEVLLMSGFFIIGGIFAADHFDSNFIIKLITLSVLSFFIVLSVYSFNAAAGKSQDSNNLRLQNLWNLNKNTFLIISVSLFIFATLIALWLSPYSLLFCTLIILLWVCYSHPQCGLKQKAIWGTVLHFMGQILHFIMAWIVFKPLSLDALYISVFFAIAFSSGHILHEIIDFKADKVSGFKTSAIIFGIKKTASILIVLLLVNTFVITFLLFNKSIESMAGILFSVCSAIHLLLILVYFKKIEEKALIVRIIYRTVYFLAGVLFFISKLFYYA